MTRRALTLPETIIAIFLLASGFVVLFRLMHAALQFQAGIDSQQTAVMLAERQVEQIRAWNRQSHGPGGGLSFSDWSACPGLGGPAPIPDYPDYQLTVAAQAKELYSPCSLFELAFTDTTRRKVLSESCRDLTVTVAWKSRTFSLRTLVGAPTGEPAPANPVEITPNGAQNFLPGDSQEFTANAVDSDGRNLPDLVFNWYIQGIGYGTINYDREGRTARLINRVYDADTPRKPTGVGSGPCVLWARARYRGKEVRGASAPLFMQAP